MTKLEELRALIAEVLDNPPQDEIWCAFCGCPGWEEHDPGCWTVRAAEAIKI